MKLITYLKDKGESVSDFAIRANQPTTTIRKIVYGQRQPSLPLAVKISQLTGGEVTEADLLLPTAVAA